MYTVADASGPTVYIGIAVGITAVVIIVILVVIVVIVKRKLLGNWIWKKKSSTIKRYGALYIIHNMYNLVDRKCQCIDSTHIMHIYLLIGIWLISELSFQVGEKQFSKTLYLFNFTVYFLKF